MTTRSNSKRQSRLGTAPLGFVFSNSPSPRQAPFTPSPASRPPLSPPRNGSPQIQTWLRFPKCPCPSPLAASPSFQSPFTPCLASRPPLSPPLATAHSKSKPGFVFPNPSAPHPALHLPHSKARLHLALLPAHPAHHPPPGPTAPPNLASFFHPVRAPRLCYTLTSCSCPNSATAATITTIATHRGRVTNEQLRSDFIRPAGFPGGPFLSGA